MDIGYMYTVPFIVFLCMVAFMESIGRSRL